MQEKCKECRERLAEQIYRLILMYRFRLSEEAVSALERLYLQVKYEED